MISALHMRINRVITTLEAMPPILRISCLASFTVGVGIVVCSIPAIGVLRINDETFSAQHLWAEGYGAFVVIAGIWMIAAGIGIFRKSGWSRWLIVFLYATAAPIEYIYSRNHSNVGWNAGLVQGAVWAVFFYWYLFYKQKRFFA